MTFNIQNASIINVEGHRISKHCKAVYCITTGEVYASVLDAAEANGVSQGAMSWALCGKSKSCKGKRFCFVSQIIEHLDEIASVNRAREAKVVAHDRMIAKQNKIREIKAKIDEHDAIITELKAKLNEEMMFIAEAQKELDELQKGGI